MSWKWTVPADFSTSSAERTDVLILKAIETGLGEGIVPPGVSRSQLHRLMDENRVRVNGTAAKKNTKLLAGNVVSIEFPEARAMELVPEDTPLEILYQDEHLVILNKPPGISVHPSNTEFEGTLVHALLHHIKDLSGIGGVLRPGIVHRLDKNTSGALVVTKTDLAHQKLVEVFSKHEIERVYHALCYGIPPQMSGKIETLIGRNPRDRKKMTTDVKTGRRAVTHYKVLERYWKEGGKTPFASLVELRLETGRTHQVRVHLTSVGASLLGDPVYGTPTERQSKWLALPLDVQEIVGRLPGQALHARVLGFAHPVTGQTLRFEANEPELFAALSLVLKKYLR
ncbi:MAG: hypothetical protein A2X94_00130 [Bdellovibrionales bacterium GWB1_55_8]|nr:MAG: hypothetical protein A2X94_00130 [Bdellovibrionales bacterium GWB1_55_8]